MLETNGLVNQKLANKLKICMFIFNTTNFNDFA